jgi:pyruvoyl-dependent arginine decarboxylase (PvlArgDC)
MNLKKSFAISLALCLSGGFLPTAMAADGNWKIGRIYYRMVCTACHKEQAGGAISPSSNTKAEWTAYIEADKHAKEKDSLKSYVSTEYRDSIKDTNKAAANKKIAAKSAEELMADVQAFVIHGAKDSDTPARCN